MITVTLTPVTGGSVDLDADEVRAVEDVVGSVVTMRDGTTHFVTQGTNLILDLLKEGAHR